ncbi:MAG: hypothetical protein WBD27_03450 [Pyrinomonadaceae bacterium]
MRLAYRKLELREFNELFVVEYSVSQNSVLVKSVTDMVHANRRAIDNGLSSDYLPVAFFAERDNAIEWSNKLIDNITKMVESQNKFHTDRKKLFTDTEDGLWKHFMNDEQKPE